MHIDVNVNQIRFLFTFILLSYEEEQEETDNGVHKKKNAKLETKENENPEYRKNCRMQDKSLIFFVFGSRNQFNSTYNILNERMHLCK